MGMHQMPNRLGLMALENIIIGELLSIMWKSLVEEDGKIVVILVYHTSDVFWLLCMQVFLGAETLADPSTCIHCTVVRTYV